MSVTIPDEILESARITPDELKLDVAILLFERGGLTLAQASRFCGVSRIRFQQELAVRQIPVHYGVRDFEDDLSRLDEAGAQ